MQSASNYYFKGKSYVFFRNLDLLSSSLNRKRIVILYEKCYFVPGTCLI